MVRVKFPGLRRTLLRLESEDQAARASADKILGKEIERQDKNHADQVLQILKIIGYPSAENVGLDGSRAIWLIAQHNCEYKNLGNDVLQKMLYLYKRDKDQVYYQGIPYLIDRLMILEHLSKGAPSESATGGTFSAKQMYGTQYWSLSPGEKGERFEVIDPQGLGDRRKEFGLGDG